MQQNSILSLCSIELKVGHPVTIFILNSDWWMAVPHRSVHSPVLTCYLRRDWDSCGRNASIILRIALKEAYLFIIHCVPYRTDHALKALLFFNRELAKYVVLVKFLRATYIMSIEQLFVNL